MKDEEDVIRREQCTPIRILGRGSFGGVYLTYNVQFYFEAVKIIQKEKSDKKEFDAILKLSQYETNYYQTLEVIAQHPQIHLPSYVLRALMKQILEGMRAFHSVGLVHRDIKCNNILLHSPPGSGRVYSKISDLGFAIKADQTNNKQTYFKGTIPYMSPEQFHDNPIITQKVDIYALGITFYKLITHKYPINGRNIKEQGTMMAKLKSIDRPSEIKDNILWDFLSRLLKFDSDKRITAAEALQHPYFTTPDAIADVSQEQLELALVADKMKENENSFITKFDIDPTFIVAESAIMNFIFSDENNKINQNEDLFKHSQKDILESSTYILYKIVNAYIQNDKEGNKCNIKEEIEKEGILDKLKAIFNQQYKFKQINYNASVGIAFIFKAQSPPDEYKKELINSLKEQSQNVYSLADLGNQLMGDYDLNMFYDLFEKSGVMSKYETEFKNEMKKIKKIKNRLVNQLDLVKVLIDSVSIGGGNEDENYCSTENALFCIMQFFGILVGAEEWQVAMPQLFIRMEEDVEVLGGLEEIDANLYHLKMNKFLSIKQYAGETIEAIIKPFIHSSNIYKSPFCY
ncbi:MAG: putative CAMK family protein kinase [Streblomastix strix]|uniref:Putative CAMK family protein kinase n=1 Tax=Streblomastix strix TaxID=222440 RepID=A0A5J4VLC8_9EUKA|nr:MAG: putative CAMK family protein kinase [Streblomastix strix]